LRVFQEIYAACAQPWRYYQAKPKYCAKFELALGLNNFAFWNIAISPHPPPSPKYGLGNVRIWGKKPKPDAKRVDPPQNTQKPGILGRPGGVND
jgi:hypothetical protein